MSDYVRPVLPRPVFYDAGGDVIDYGNRWPGRIAPEDSYSVVSNPERFAPLHVVADALIQHLARDFLVEVDESPTYSNDLMHPRDDVLRAVRVTPANAGAASLTFVFTSFPGIVVHAGLLHDFPYPDCGCDACDDAVEGLAEEMETAVFAVVAGGYSESLNLEGALNVGYQLIAGNHRRSHRSRREDYPAERLRLAEARLRELPEGWQVWASAASTVQS